MPIKESFRDTVIYLRTSTNDQNPDNQLKDCESIRPIDQTTKTFVDYKLIKDNQSAWYDYKERPGFDELYNLIKKRKLKNLIVWDLDRIYRNRTKLMEFFRLCKGYDIKIYSYNQQFLQDINNIPAPWNEVIHDLMIQILGWMAQDESDKKSKRVKLAIRRKEKGTYSYLGNKWGRKSLSTYKKNKIIQYYNQNMSIRNIAKELKISVGAVHKYLASTPPKKKVNSPVQ